MTTGIYLAGQAVQSPPQLTGDVDDWGPTGSGNASTLLITSSQAVAIKGFAGGTAKRVVRFVNEGAYTITLTTGATSSSAANRFRFSEDITLTPGQAAELLYSDTIPGWITAGPVFEQDTPPLRVYPYLYSSAAAINAALAADVTAGRLVAGDTIETASYHQGSQYGGTRYAVVAADTGTDDGGAYVDVGTVQLQAIFGGVVDVTQFGAVVDGETSDAAAIMAAITHAEAATPQMTVRFPPGVMAIGSSTITVLGANIEADSQAELLYSGTGDAFVVGSASTLVSYRTMRLPAVRRSTAGWSTTDNTVTLGSDRGVVVLAANTLEFTVPRIENFSRGLVLAGANQGVVYNNFRLGSIRGAINIELKPTGTGWSNQNTFYGGRLAVLNSGTGVHVNTRQILLADAAANSVNNNTWVGTSLEGPRHEFQIECWGTYNVFINCRFEASPTVAWRSGTITALNNLIIGGFDAQNIVFTEDAGTKWNAIVSPGGKNVIDGSSSQSVLAVRNTSSSNNNALTIHTATSSTSNAEDASTSFAFGFSGNAMRAKAPADTHDRLRITPANGRLYLGNGSTDITTLAYLRYATSATWELTGAALRFASDNTHDLGTSGFRPRDVNVGRNVVIGGAIDHDGSTAGFFGATPVAQQAASSLSELWTALKNLGLLTSGSTAP